MRTWRLAFILLVYSGTSVFAQNIPFAVIADKDGYTNIRNGKNRNVVDKVYDNQVFAIRSVVDEDGWQAWYWVNYPDYALAKKSFEKYISKTKEGMMHGSRIKRLTDLPQWQKKSLPNASLICKDGANELTIRYGKFAIDKHQYTRDKEGTILKIDGSEPWGIDGYVYDDMKEIKSISLKLNGVVYPFPSEAIKNMMQPNTSLQNFGVAQGAGNTLFLYMSNSDGAGSYDVVWTIKDGKAISQFLYRDF